MTFQHWFWSTSTPKLWIKVVTSYLCSVFPTFPYSPHGQSSTTKKSWWVCIDPVGLRAQDLLCQEDSQFIWILILPDIKRIVYDSIVPYHHEADGVLNTVHLFLSTWGLVAPNVPQCALHAAVAAPRSGARCRSNRDLESQQMGSYTKHKQMVIKQQFSSNIQLKHNVFSCVCLSMCMYM